MSSRAIQNALLALQLLIYLCIFTKQFKVFFLRKNISYDKLGLE